MAADIDNRDLQRFVYQTVRYHDLFKLPVTAVQIWRALIVQPSAVGVEQRVPRLLEIAACLTVLVNQGDLGTSQGYYFLLGRAELLAERQRRFWLTQDKWKKTRRVIRVLALVPFVRLLAMSGSLAMGNTKAESDLDIFVVTKPGHIWTTRLLLLLSTQLLGVRRKYWDRQAPNKVCLNHYITSDALVITPAIQNLYTAMLYQHLIPLTGLAVGEEFKRANRDWIKRQLMFSEGLALPSVLAVRVGWLGHRVRQLIEQLLSEPIFSSLESWAERWQRRSIAKHTKPNQPGRVALSATELAFHPYTKVPLILSQFAAGVGQD